VLEDADVTAGVALPDFKPLAAAVTEAPKLYTLQKVFLSWGRLFFGARLFLSLFLCVCLVYVLGKGTRDSSRPCKRARERERELAHARARESVRERVRKRARA